MLKKSTQAKIKELFNDIDSIDPSRKEEGERLLSFLKTKKELKTLAQMAKNANFKVKYYVIKHLGKFDYDSVIEDIAGFLNDKHKSIRKTAENALSRIKSEVKYDYLFPVIHSENQALRIYAIKSLGEGEQVNATLELIGLLKDSDPEIRFQAINSLRLIKDYRSDKKVIERLSDPAPKVRFAAAFYCGCRKVKSSCNDLLKLMLDQNPKIRSACAWSLGQIQYFPSITKLKEFLKTEKDKNVKNEIFRVMHKVGIVKLYNQNDTLITTEDEQTKGISDWLLTYIMSEKKIKTSDICLFVEGAYPYISGGVSSWTRDLLKNFKDYTFSIVHIAASRSQIREFKYDLPENVIYFQEVYLYDLPELTGKVPANKIMDEHKFNMLYSIITNLDNMNEASIEMICEKLGILGDFQIDPRDIFTTKNAWRLVKKLYNEYIEDVPFLEYIWNFRSIALPIYNLMRSRIPPAKAYYTPLTGYAGLMAVLAKIIHKKPMILTEHGIYHRERMMEIKDASWIYDVSEMGLASQEVFSGMKRIWVGMYRTFSALAYRFANEITTLNKDNALIQVEGGADPSKISIIPNGIDTSNFEHIKNVDLREKDHYVVGLVGRVVPVKDIKTYIWAAKKVMEKMPGKVKFLIMGPYDEDREYAEECFALTSMLNMNDVITYTGTVDLREYFKYVDIVVLTSISEGQPLSLMEAMAAGRPCVSTHVGSCRELLYGRGRTDQKLGRCGIITNVHAPWETANAIVEILQDPDLYNLMSHVGRTRIKYYYQIGDIFKMYRDLFKKHLRK